MARSTEERFMAFVHPEPMTGCWLWTGATNQGGYGIFQLDGRPRGAHRVSHEIHIGPIPTGLDIDHVAARGCASKACVNPAHLEPVTERENTLRADSPATRNAAKTECPHGHAYSDANTLSSGGRRICRACKRAYDTRRRATKKAAKLHCDPRPQPKGRPNA